MTEKELKEIEARANAATAGPLECVGPVGPKEVYYVGPKYNPEFSVATMSTCNTEGPKANGDFFAHARADIPALIAHIRELREALEFYAHPEVGLFDSRDVIKGYVICRKCNTRMDTLLSTEVALKALGLSTNREEG